MEGLQNIDSIIAESDGVMVARGDMGVELLPEKVFIAQKSIIAKCNMVSARGVCPALCLMVVFVHCDGASIGHGRGIAGVVDSGSIRYHFFVMVMH